MSFLARLISDHTTCCAWSACRTPSSPRERVPDLAGGTCGEGFRVSYERRGRVAGLYVSWHRSDGDGADHAITDEEFARGRRDNTHGRYKALCGHVVLTGSMLLPPGHLCPRCYAFLVARSTLPTVERRIQRTRHRKPSALRRLLRGSQLPTLPPYFPRQQSRPAPERNGRTPVPAGAGSATSASASAGRHALRDVR